MALAKTKTRRNFSDDPEEFRATLGEHIDELRTRLIRIAVFLVAASVAGWFGAIPLYKFLEKDVRRSIPKWLDYREVFPTFTEPFMLQMRVAFVIGLSITIPYALWHVWQFVRPGLKPNERRPVKAMVPVSAVLFLLGCFVGWIMVPPTVTWFCSFFRDFQGSTLYQAPGTMVFLLIKLVFAFGIGFQLPIVTFILTKVGLVSSESLFRYWRHATVAIFVLSMVLTPSGDPFTMLAMAAPLTLLFFASVYAVKITSKDKGRESPEHELNNLD